MALSVGLGTLPRAVCYSLCAGPIFQDCPSLAGVVRRRGSSIGSSHTGRHSAVCHLVRAWPWPPDRSRARA